MRKVILWIIWILFVSYTLWLAPLDHPYTWYVGRKLITLQWGEVNAYLIAILGLMGVWPLIYACLMVADDRTQNFRAWTYFVGSNFTGVICLLPYLIFRRSNQEFYGGRDRLLDILERRSTGVTLLVTTVMLISYALIAGDWADYIQLFQTKPFVHLISLDFCLMCLIFPIASLFDDDMGRRGIHNPSIFWAVALVPLFGPLLYLCWRPSLDEAYSKPHPMELKQFT
jgi:hypothetical protein